MLTDARVRTAKAGADLYRLKDTNGLFLYVSTTGRKTWRYHYEWLKKNQSLTLLAPVGSLLSKIPSRHPTETALFLSATALAGRPLRPIFSVPLPGLGVPQ